MRLPRDMSGDALPATVRRLGYQVSRQTGSHLRLTTQVNGEHHITIPRHSSLRVGTLASILDEIAAHQSMTREEVAGKLLGS